MFKLQKNGNSAGKQLRTWALGFEKGLAPRPAMEAQNHSSFYRLSIISITNTLSIIFHALAGVPKGSLLPPQLYHL